jgi:alkylation response protein AidB-like acyl-CoA dehydrogenase
MATQITAAKMLVLKAATEKTERYFSIRTIAKLFASQAAMDTTIEAVKFTAVMGMLGRLSRGAV